MDEVSYALNGRTVNVGMSVTEDTFSVNGTTNHADLLLEMQFIAAHMTDPGYRSSGYNRSRALLPAALEAQRATPQGVFHIDGSVLLASGDQRKALPSAEEVSSKIYDMDNFRPDLKRLMAAGPITITMVGDMSVESAIEVTAKTFGALPARPPAGPPPLGADQRHFPAAQATPITMFHKGLAEQGLAVIAFPGPDVTQDPTEATRLELLNAVLKLRVLDEIRERLALAYAPGIRSSYSTIFPGYGYVQVQAATAPEKIPAFFAAMDEILAKLQSDPVSADELKRAREPLVAGARQQRNTNGFWLVQISQTLGRPLWASKVLKNIELWEAMTPQDLQTLARKYFAPGKAWRAQVLPEISSSAPTS
jgi:zinc protease